jgi:hypothetical protein
MLGLLSLQMISTLQGFTLESVTLPDPVISKVGTIETL